MREGGEEGGERKREERRGVTNMRQAENVNQRLSASFMVNTQKLQ